MNLANMKLGKQAPRYDSRTLMLADYLRPKVLPPPRASIDWTPKVHGWGMMGNDTLGDCTCAAAGHLIELWSANVSHQVTPTTTQIVAAYSAITGYTPSNPNSDRGAVELDVLKYWRSSGIAGQKITAFVSIEPGNHADVMDGVDLFGAVYIGLALPVSAQKQTTWSVPPGGAVGPGAPGSWGGHAVPIVAYDARTCTVVTWGALKQMTWQFLDTYGDEIYAVLSPQWIDSAGKAPPGLDLTALMADLNELTGSGKSKSRAKRK